MKMNLSSTLRSSASARGTRTATATEDGSSTRPPSAVSPVLGPRTPPLLRRTAPFRKLQAMTLVEMMVAVGVGSMVLMSMAVIFATSSRSFAAMGNYVGMDRASRNALDQMSRDIRRSRDLISFSNTKLEFNYLGATNLVYNWNSSLQQLTQWKTGDAKTNVLLTNCAWLQFSMYKNIPLPGGTNATTTLPSEGKAISVAWKCSQKILSKTVTSEDMQQAMIVIRNKLVP